MNTESPHTRCHSAPTRNLRHPGGGVAPARSPPAPGRTGPRALLTNPPAPSPACPAFPPLRVRRTHVVEGAHWEEPPDPPTPDTCRRVGPAQRSRTGPRRAALAAPAGVRSRPRPIAPGHSRSDPQEVSMKARHRHRTHPPRPRTQPPLAVGSGLHGWPHCGTGRTSTTAAEACAGFEGARHGGTGGTCPPDPRGALTAGARRSGRVAACVAHAGNGRRPS